MKPQIVIENYQGTHNANLLQSVERLEKGKAYKMELFNDPRIEKPWFRTCQDWDPQRGSKIYTQDLYFFEKIRQFGYRVACDTRVKVGHYAFDQDIVW